MRKTPFRLGFALSVLLASSLAGADLAPAPGYVEGCTLEKQQKSGEECVACSASYEDAEACKTKHEGGGMKQRCKTSGASVWTEIWCREKAEAASPPASAREPASAPVAPSAAPVAPSAAPEKSGSCGACAAVGERASDAALGASAALLAALWLRRRRAG